MLSYVLCGLLLFFKGEFHHGKMSLGQFLKVEFWAACKIFTAIPT